MLDIFHEAECASTRNLAAEHLAAEIAGEELTADCGAFEFDLDFKPGSPIGAEFSPGGAAFNPYRLEYPNITALDREHLEARLVECLHEHCSAAVEDWHLAAVNIDRQIVDAKRKQRRHEMFDGSNMVAQRITENSAQVSGPHLRNQCPQFIVGGFGTQAMKHDAGVWIGGAKLDSDRFSAVNTYAGEGRARFDCGLKVLQLSPRRPAQSALPTCGCGSRFILYPDFFPKNPPSFAAKIECPL